MYTGIAMERDHARMGSGYGKKSLAEVQRIVRLDDQVALQRNLTSDPFFLSYVFGYSLLGGESPPFPRDLQFQLAPMMMKTHTLYDSSHLLDSEHYTTADGIIYGLKVGHPLAPYKAYFLACQDGVYHNYTFEGSYVHLHSVLVKAIIAGMVQMKDLRNTECFFMAKYLLQPAEVDLAITSDDSDVRGRTLLLYSGKRLRAGDFLSVVADRGGDGNFMSRVWGCFLDDNQRIVLQGTEMSRADIPAAGLE